jgi:hypothetical protein
MRTRWAPIFGAMGIVLSTTGAHAEDAPPPAPDSERLAGFQDGFFLRERHDWFRIYPRARLNLDLNGSVGPGVSQLKGADGGTALGPKVLVRRLRLELGGDFIQERIAFFGSVDFGGQTITNANGKTIQSAASPGATPSASSARWAAVQTASPVAMPQDVWINLKAWRWLNLMIGQYQAPFSMENRTGDGLGPWMERNLAVRGFVVPMLKEIGMTLWGSLPEEAFGYEIGVFGGDGQNRPNIDDRVDWIGRVYARPLAHVEGALTKTQIGMSARHGDRDPTKVAYDYPTITTGQAFTLWDPTYTDSQKRLIHVIPSGAQNQIGGELRVPMSRAALQAEAYWVDNHTREAVDGYQLTNTERFGHVHGAGWYVQLSCWPLGDAWIAPDPGMVRPRTLDLHAPPERLKKGLELLMIVAGVDATYDGASRGGIPDKKKPPANIRIYEYGFGANYWVSRFFRATFNYIVYHTPMSGTPDNGATVPGNLGKTPSPGAHVLHEISARLAVQL